MSEKCRFSQGTNLNCVDLGANVLTPFEKPHLNRDEHELCRSFECPAEVCVKAVLLRFAGVHLELVDALYD